MQRQTEHWKKLSLLYPRKNKERPLELQLETAQQQWATTGIKEGIKTSKTDYSKTEDPNPKTNVGPVADQAMVQKMTEPLEQENALHGQPHATSAMSRDTTTNVVANATPANLGVTETATQDGAKKDHRQQKETTNDHTKWKMKVSTLVSWQSFKKHHQ